jgi:uncharacterized protein
MILQYGSNRIWAENEKKELIAEVLFPFEGDAIVNITHTFVDDSLRGQGAAGKLMQAAANVIRKNSWKAKITCSYAVVWFQKHPEYNDILD